MKYRIVNGTMAVLVEVYLAPCGFVAHWFTSDGTHLFEPITPIFKRQTGNITADALSRHPKTSPVAPGRFTPSPHTAHHPIASPRQASARQYHAEQHSKPPQTTSWEIRSLEAHGDTHIPGDPRQSPRYPRPWSNCGSPCRSCGRRTGQPAINVSECPIPWQCLAGRSVERPAFPVSKHVTR